MASRGRARRWGWVVAGPRWGNRAQAQRSLLLLLPPLAPLPSPPAAESRRRSIPGTERWARPVADRGHAHSPPTPTSAQLARGSRRREGGASAARCGGEADGGSSRDTEHTRPTRRRGGVEAAGRGGAGKRAVRQRDPTWALRCPAFPSLKYYSVRREREPRSPGEPSPPFSRHEQRTLATPSSRASRVRLRFTEGLDAVAESWFLVFFSFFFFFFLPAVRPKRINHFAKGPKECPPRERRVVSRDEIGVSQRSARDPSSISSSCVDAAIASPGIRVEKERKEGEGERKREIWRK